MQVTPVDEAPENKYEKATEANRLHGKDKLVPYAEISEKDFVPPTADDIQSYQNEITDVVRGMQVLESMLYKIVDRLYSNNPDEVKYELAKEMLRHYVMEEIESATRMLKRISFELALAHVKADQEAAE